MLRSISAFVLVCAACSGGVDPEPEPQPSREHDARFVGLWAVEQPSHALYEVTYYDLRADGAIAIGPSDPADCQGHLGQHCVTGSVAACVPTPEQGRCQAELTCVFGATWWSRGSDTLVIAGDCSDAAPREIVLRFAADATGNSSAGGGGATLLTVGGDANWSHDNWDWVFRKCPSGDVTACRSL